MDELIKQLQEQIAEECSKRIEKFCETKINSFIDSHKQELEKAIEILTSISNEVDALRNNEDDAESITVKTGTVLVFAMINRVQHGENLYSYTKDDWSELLKEVSENVILKDGTSYSIFIFKMYAEFIKSVNQWIGNVVSERFTESITEIEMKLRVLIDNMENGEVDEAAFIQEALELCLDAVIKILICVPCIYVGRDAIPEDFIYLAQSIGEYLFQYGRYKLYSEEKALLDAYLQAQGELDEELQNRFDAYIEKLKNELNEFNNLLDKSLEDNLDIALEGSAELAKYVGSSDDVLETVEDVDEFFM